MKKLLFLPFAVLFFSCNAQDSYIKKIQQYQYEQNQQFLDKNTSPLTKEDFKTFKSLDFFLIDKKYRVIAKLKKTPNAPIFEMPTTTDRKPLYKKYGILTFTIDGKEFQLDVFQNQDLGKNPKYKDYLFLPFTDKTSGTTSYGGGRFVEVLTTDELNDEKIIIDFNKTYNPYCAYNSKYSCPITPKQNHIDIKIKAGIKAYKKH